MKYFLLFLVSSIALAAEPAPQGPRWKHLQDADGKILATIDSKDGSIEYKEDAKKLVPLLLQAIDNLAKECAMQKQAGAAVPKKVAPAAKK